MTQWSGDTSNNPPNPVQSDNSLSDSKLNLNRANQVRRDKDTQKNFSVGLYDIDEAILFHINSLNLSVIDDGQSIKVPIYLGSPEKWKSAQKDRVIRDNNGKVILPAIIFKRDQIEKDPAMITLNRYLSYPVIKKYDEKNRYTKFNLLVGKNVPTNNVYNVTMPDHIILSYKFIIWTEYIQQMNKLVETINFATEDYWGDKKRFKFRTKIDSFVHTVELDVEDDRIVRTEFTLTVWGYLLPEFFDNKKPTTIKSITPKKIVFGAEVVSTDFEIDKEKLKNKEKWRNQNFPNLPASEDIPSPTATWGNTISEDGRNVEGILDTLSLIKSSSDLLQSSGLTNQIEMRTPPVSSDDYGEEGWVAYDKSYVYFYSNTQWRRIAINTYWQNPPNSQDDYGQEGWMAYDKSYFYIYSKGKWRRAPISLFT